MNAPNVRSVTVELNAQVAKYIADMKAAGKATNDSFGQLDRQVLGLNRRLGSLDKRLQSTGTSMGQLGSQTRLSSPGMQRLSTDIDRVGSSSRRATSDINQLTGRLRLMLEGVATIGPGVLPLGAVGVAGVGGLAAVFGAATVGALGLAAATQGVGNALGAVQKARLDPTVENIAAAEEAMSRIGPEAREFVRHVQHAVPLMRALRDTGAAGFFPGLTEAVDDFDKLEPVLTRFMKGVGEAGGSAVANVADSLTSDRWAPFLEFLSEEAPEAITNLTALTGSLAHGTAEMWMAFDPSNDGFIDWALSVGDAFDGWASSAKGREDIAAFMAYAQENGPKVADFFTAAADAMAQIVEAAAPLGGPVLTVLTKMLELTANIADSDLGTPILAAVAAYSALNRIMLITQGIQTRMTGTAAAGGGLAAKGGLFGFATAGAQKARTTLGQLRSDLAVLSPAYATAATRAERFSTAAGSLRKHLGGVAKGAAAVGGLAVATTGAADSIGLTNTVSLALMGTMAGPWGAAIGAGVGLTLDLANNMDKFSAASARANAAIASGDMTQMTNELQKQRDLLYDLQDAGETTGVGDFFGDLFSSFGNIGAGTSSLDEMADSQRKISTLRTEMAAKADQLTRKEAKLTKTQYDLGRAMGFSRGKLLEVGKAAEASVAQWDSLGDSLNDPKVSLSGWVDELREQTRAIQDQAANAQKALDMGLNPKVLTKLLDAGPEGALRLDQIVQGGPKAIAELNKVMGLLRAAKAELKGKEIKARLALDDKQFRKVANSALGKALGLDKLILTPKAGLNDSQFRGKRARIIKEIIRLDNTYAAAEAGLRDMATKDLLAILAKVRKYAGQKPKPTVSVNDRATPTLRDIFGLMGRLHDKTINVTTVYRRQGVPSTTDTSGRSRNDVGPADGGTVGGGRWYRNGVWHHASGGSTVPKTGLPYADRHPYLLADGEEVTSNRRGQADLFRPELKDINLGLSRREVIERMLARGLADGGTTSHTGTPNRRSDGPMFRAGGPGGGEVRHIFEVRVVGGELDWSRAKAQIQYEMTKVGTQKSAEYAEWSDRQEGWR